MKNSSAYKLKQNIYQTFKHTYLYMCTHILHKGTVSFVVSGQSITIRQSADLIAICMLNGIIPIHRQVEGDIEAQVVSSYRKSA